MLVKIHLFVKNTAYQNRAIAFDLIEYHMLTPWVFPVSGTYMFI